MGWLQKGLLQQGLLQKALLLLVLAAGAAWGEVEKPQCELNFDQSLTVDAQGLTVAQWHFGADGQVSQDGQPLALSAEQRQLVADYAGAVHALVPELLALVRDTLKLVARALGETFSELFGADSEVAIKTELAIQQAGKKLDSRVQQSEGRYQLTGGEQDLFDEAFGEEFEQAVEEAASEAVGSGMSLVWKAMFDPDFGARMEQFGERMEAEMALAAKAVEARADSFCQQARKVDGLETRLREGVPELAHYRLVRLAQAREVAEQ